MSESIPFGSPEYHQDRRRFFARAGVALLVSGVGFLLGLAGMELQSRALAISAFIITAVGVAGGFAALGLHLGAQVWGPERAGRGVIVALGIPAAYFASSWAGASSSSSIRLLGRIVGLGLKVAGVALVLWVVWTIARYLRVRKGLR
jgi:hypothetical protein